MRTNSIEPEEVNTEKISLKDVYDLVKQLKSDIDTKYNTIAAKAFDAFFTLNKDLHNHHTRSSAKIRLNYIRTN